jgi:hypothetical protein
VCFKAVMISKPQSYLASKRSRHQRSDGDCALSLGTPVASISGHVSHTIWPHGQSPLPESRLRLLLSRRLWASAGRKPCYLSDRILVSKSGEGSIYRYVSTRDERGSIRRQKKSDLSNIAWFANSAQRMEPQHLLLARHALRKPLLQ